MKINRLLAVLRGHAAYGLARVCRAEGDAAAEKRYLTEAMDTLVPLMGEGAAKCQAGLARLAEL